MTSPEDLPLRNGEDSGNTDNGVARGRGQRTLKGDGYSANMKRLDDLNKDLAEFNKAKKFEDYMKSIHEAQVAGDDALLDELITQHEAEVQAEYEKAQEEKRAREQAYEQMSDEEKRQNYEQELAQSQAEYDANHPEGAENGDPAEAEAGKNEPVTLEETVKKHHMSKAAKITTIVAIATAIAGIGIGIGSLISGGSKTSDSKTPGGGFPSAPEPAPTTVTAPEAPEIPVAVGEKEKPKLKYDYSEWRDFTNKSSHDAYGADYSDCYNNPEKTTEGFLGEAEKMPEALASYKGAFFEDEQKELGIFDMTREELDNAMSDVNSEDSAVMQQKMLNALGKIFDDKENTKWAYNIENNKENSNYVIWEDENSDGVQTPDEMHLGYRIVSRHNAPQANLYRRDKNGNWVKMLDLNLYCGFQPNTPTGEKPDVPYVSEGEKAPTKDDNKKDKPTEGDDKKDNNKKDKPTEGDDKKEDKPTEDDNKGGETPTTSPTPEYPIITTPSEPPVTVLASKNEENFNRIAADTEKSHEEDLHIVDYTPFRDADVTKVEDITKEPTAENYEGTTPAIARNEKAEESEPVGRDHLWVSIPENETPPSPVGEKNDYGDNLGGANDQNARENPVESNQESQNQAGQNRIPDNELPGAGDQGTRDLLAELGIF